MIRKFSALFAMAVVCGALAGCSTDQNSLCPGAAALVEASALTGFAKGVTPDPTQALYRVAVSNVTIDCDIDANARTADSSLTIHFVATRKASAEAAQYRVPYFVAVRQGADIEAKKIFEASFSFDAGETRTNFDESIGSTVIKIANDKQPYDYQILVGFQLTRAQLEYNRKIGHYGP